MSEIITFQNVNLRIQQKKILDRINLKIFQNERVAIFGKSGSGKSTLLKMIVGGYVPTTGKILFRQTPVSAQTIGGVRQSVAFIGQEPVIGAETVRAGLLLPFHYQANAHLFPADSLVEQTLRNLELSADILNQKVNSISGGEKQRIAIARSLLLKKDIFLLDEITSALDAESKAAVLKLLCLDNKYTILSVTHDQEWLRHCQRFIEIEAGHIKADFTDFHSVGQVSDFTRNQINSK